MLKIFRADLHIHTCLSPCGELEMSPSSITAQAKSRDINILGICDHNTAENVRALVQAAQEHKIVVLPGLEITSQEEVHILALFDEIEPALELQEIVYAHLPGENDEETFGMQVVVNKDGEVLSFNNKLLIGASTLSIEDVVQAIHAHDGLAIASHIDREGFSLIGQLGFIPDHLDLDAVEISPKTTFEEAVEKYNPPFPITIGSDAHFLNDIGTGITSFFIAEGTTGEIKKALLSQDGRRIIH